MATWSTKRSAISLHVYGKVFEEILRLKLYMSLLHVNILYILYQGFSHYSTPNHQYHKQPIQGLFHIMLRIWSSNHITNHRDTGKSSLLA